MVTGFFFFSFLKFPLPLLQVLPRVPYYRRTHMRLVSPSRPISVIITLPLLPPPDMTNDNNHHYSHHDDEDDDEASNRGRNHVRCVVY